MCLYPKIILNPRYKPNKKNGYNPPKCEDERMRYVAVGCGKCIECCHQKANAWRQRLYEELKVSKGQFITLTFSDESLAALQEELHVTHQCNAVAGLAVRRFLERYRKSRGHSVKHLFITELGSKENSERLHLHGIIFNESMTTEELSRFWKYGRVDIGYACNEKSINYIVKYMHKPDTAHLGYQPQVFCSPGIGRNFVEIKRNAYKYKRGESRETYTTSHGNPIGLCLYYRNHFYTEDERQKLWCDRLDRQERYILGQKIDISNGDNLYWSLLKNAQARNRLLGFGSNEWDRDKYSLTLRMLNKKTVKKEDSSNLSTRDSLKMFINFGMKYFDN